MNKSSNPVLETDDRFENLLIELSADEQAALRESIQREGCREAICTWRGVIVDGHNRYAICRDLGKPYTVREMDFSNADAVMDWIDANQLARRNLTPDAFRLTLGRRYNRTKRQDLGHGDQKSGGQVDLPKTADRLALEHGVSEATVKRAGKFAVQIEHEPDLQEAIRTRQPIAKVKKERRKQANQRALATAQKKIEAKRATNLDSVCDLRVCTCAELFASGIRPDAVITDPPYPRKFLPVFSELAQACKAAKVPLVAVMSGQSYLPEVMARLCEHLTYRWTLAYLTPGGQAVQQWAAKVNTAWKPVLLFGSPAMGREWFGDVATSKPNDNDKRFHEWGQSETGMADLVQRLTKPGQLVCDPFLGGGSTAVVSLALGRRFVGCDINPHCITTTRARVQP